MKSYHECFEHAVRCVEMAAEVQDDQDRAMLLTAARHWRHLGEEARRAEASGLRRGPSEAAPEPNKG